LEQYNLSITAGSTNPYGKIVDDTKTENKYSMDAHKYLETKRVERDYLLAQIVEKKGDKISFLSVTKDEKGYHLVYNPFDDETRLVCGFANVEATHGKKGAQIYNTAAKGLVRWSYTAITTPLDDLFVFKLADGWVNTSKYRNDIPGFCREVANIMRNCPHVECHAYSVYMDKFMRWMQTFEDDPITIGNIVHGLIEKLKYVFFKDTRAKLEAEGTLLDTLYLEPTTLSLQDCSKKCHDLFKKLDFKAEKSINFLQAIMKSHDEAVAARNAKIAAARAPKRKLDQVDPAPGEDDDAKRRKMADNTLVLSNNPLEDDEE